MNPLEVIVLLVLVQVTLLSILGRSLICFFPRNAAVRHSIALACLLLLTVSPFSIPWLPANPLTEQLASYDSQAGLESGLSNVTSSPSVASKRPIEFLPEDPHSRNSSKEIKTPAPERQPSPFGSSFTAIDAMRHESRLASAVPDATKQGIAAGWRSIGNLFVHLAIGIWALIFLVKFFAWLLRHRRIHTLCRSKQPISLPSHVRHRVTRALNLASMPKVYESDQLNTPAVVGVARPVIILPSWLLRDATDKELTDVLIHEGAHIARADMWPHLLQQMLQIIYWFHPGVRGVVHELSRAREELCDNYVLQQSDAADYAQVLLSLSENCTDRLVALSLFQKRWSLEDRVVGILHPRRNTMHHSSKRSFWTIAVALGSLCVLLGGIGATVRRQTEAAEKPQAENVEQWQGTAAPGANVEIYRYDTPDGEPRSYGTQTANAQGHFSFPNPPHIPSDGQIVFVSRKPGLATAVQFVSVDQVSQRVELSAKKASLLKGTVVDQDGLPIENAIVTTQHSKNLIPRFGTATTNRDGEYEIADLPAWKPEDTRTFDPETGTGTITPHLFLWIRHPNYPDTVAKVKKIPSTLAITLLPPAIIEGRVIDLVSGEPMANIEVQAQGVVEHGWGSTRTDDHGNYAFRLTTDHYNIWAEASDRMPLAAKAVKAVQGERVLGVDIRMTQGGYVEGRVLDAQGNPPDLEQRTLHVAHHGPARPRTGPAVTSAKVNPDGSYRLHVAPGRNYVYVMSENQPATYLTVGEGQTVQHDFVLDSEVGRPNELDPDQRLGNQLREAARQEQRRRENPERSVKRAEAATLRSDTTVAKLLTKLDDIHHQTGQAFKEPWFVLLKRIADRGPDAVPELCAELDRTEDDMMIRCVALLLRSIGDQRAVPALIRAIPKTLLPPGSDMGFRIKSKDESVIEFYRNADLVPDSDDSGFATLGRPVREVFGSLKVLTEQNFGEDELFHVFQTKDAPKTQQRAKAMLFHRVATKWTAWWNHEGRLAISNNELEPLEPPTQPKVGGKAIDLNTRIKTDSGSSGWTLESIRNEDHEHAFYDLDTGRATKLPAQFRNRPLTDPLLTEIQSWARQEGFDLMGDEIDRNGKQVFVIRPLEMKLWKLGSQQWQADLKGTSVQKLRSQGKLFEHDALMPNGTTNVDELTTFFFETSDGSPGILYRGVQVLDTNVKPGRRSPDDPETDTVGFHKGRRFGTRHLVPEKGWLGW